MNLRLPRLILGLALLVCLALAGSRASAADSLTPFEQQVFDLVNQQRAANGLPALRLDWRLVAAARAHNNLMAQRNELSHQLSGEVPVCGGGANDDRYDAVGYPWNACGENVAAGQSSPQQVVNDWMNSPGHRANILNSSYRDIGVAHTTGGSYGNWWTQDFGRTSEAVPPSQPAPVWSVAYDIGRAPGTWQVGSWQAYYVTVRNTGNTTWPAGGERRVHLGVRAALASSGGWLSDWRYDLPYDVAPGASVTVLVSHPMPATTQPANLVFQMVKEYEFWFSQTATRPVAIWGVEYDLSRAPFAWSRNQAQSFNITLRNIGNMTWSAGGGQPVYISVHFATANGGFATYNAWLNDRWFTLPGDVPPGGTVTRSVNPLAPGSRGSFYLEASLVKNGAFWFGQSANRQVSVN